MIRATGLAMAALMALAGCSPEPTIPMQKEQPMTAAEMQPGRFRVERVAVFADEIAYNDRRGIYVITDTQTGREYIGVSGVGVTETGSHSCGKSCTEQDER